MKGYLFSIQRFVLLNQIQDLALRGKHPAECLMLNFKEILFVCPWSFYSRGTNVYYDKGNSIKLHIFSIQSLDKSKQKNTNA